MLLTVLRLVLLRLLFVRSGRACELLPAPQANGRFFRLSCPAVVGCAPVGEAAPLRLQTRAGRATFGEL